MNSALGAIGNTVTLLPTTETTGADLKNLDGSATDTLVILGGNPVIYNLNWSPKQNRKPSFDLAVTKTKRRKSQTGISRWRIISNRGAMRRPAMARLCRSSR
jgi:hypothetical protein